jgi:hypothetical protein
MNKTTDLVIRITVPVDDDTTPEDMCEEAHLEGKPLLAVPDDLSDAVLELVRGRDNYRFNCSLEPGREPGRSMTRAEAELFRAGVAAGMALTMEASRLHESDMGGEGPLSEMECLLADYTGQDYEDYAEDEAALRLLRLIRCEWNGAHWITMTPGNEPARQATLDAAKPWDHSDPWGE